MPVFIDINGNYYFAATGGANDMPVVTASAALVTALTAVTPNPKQVIVDRNGVITLANPIFNVQPGGVGQRILPTPLNPSGTITVSDTVSVPAGVNSILIDIVGGGGGGAGGTSTPGGGGGGGGGGLAMVKKQFSVVPGETLTITIGAAGAAGAINGAGGAGGITTIKGSSSGTIMGVAPGGGGVAGTGTDGGAGGASGGNTSGSGGGVGAVGSNATPVGWILNTNAGAYLASSSQGAGGGALNFAGGITALTTATAYRGYGLPYVTPITPPAGGASGGGGGQGGSNILFGLRATDDGLGFGGLGGANGAAGNLPSEAIGYGNGGGGGSGNAVGAAGRSGAVRIYY